MTDQNTFAIADLQQKANDGDAQAQFDLALCYANGTDIEKNQEFAFEWHKKAAEQGHVSAQFALGLHYFLCDIGRLNTLIPKWCNDKFIIKNIDAAFELAFVLALSRMLIGNDDLAFVWLKNAAEQNHTEANYWLGICYRDGIGTQQNDGLAFEHFKKAAELGYVDAYYYLAICYRDSKGCQQNYELAFNCVTKAVEYADACFLQVKNHGIGFEKNIAVTYLFLGELYANGKGVDQSDELAFHWYEKAAEKGITEAQCRLAYCYEYGIGVEINTSSANKWYQAVIDSDNDVFNAEEKYHIAKKYLYGNGLEKDSTTGMNWLIKAVQANHAEAYQWMENTYLNFVFPYFSERKEIDQCYEFAFEWLLSSHKQNPEDFEINFGLAVLYAFGKGVEKNQELGIEHFTACMDECDNAVNERAVAENFIEIFYDFSDLFNDISTESVKSYYFDVLAPFFLEENPISNAVLPSLRIAFHLQMGEFELLKEFLNSFENLESSFNYLSSKKSFKNMGLTINQQAEDIVQKNKELEEKNKELNNLIAMFAHNFLGTLQCIRSNAEHDNNAKIHLKTVKMMSGALTAFSIISADDDKLIEQLKQDNTGETNLLQNLANNLALAISQLLSKTNKDKIINLYLNYLRKTNQIEINTSSEELGKNKDYRKKWQALQHQWEDEFNALFSENVELSSLQTWLADNFFPVQITGFDNNNIRFKEYGITDSIFLVVFMEILVNALKYMDVSQNKPLILTLDKQDQHYHLICENPSSQETYRGTHKGMDFLKSIARKLNAQFITESTEQQFKTTFIIPAELLD